MPHQSNNALQSQALVLPQSTLLLAPKVHLTKQDPVKEVQKVISLKRDKSAFDRIFIVGISVLKIKSSRRGSVGRSSSYS